LNLNSDLLHYYEQELTYLRNRGREFAQTYPRIADRLELQDGYPADPHVERLIESFALLTGRIRHEMEAEFPEISTALLGILHPHLVQPVPPLAVAKFQIDARRGKFTTGHLIPEKTPLFTYGSRGVACRFRTCYPVTAWPVRVAQATFESAAKYDFAGSDARVARVLRLRMEVLTGSLADLEMDSLRFYLDVRSGPAYLIYELLFCALKEILILPESSKEPVPLPLTSITPVGFEKSDATVPSPAHGRPGYQLLQEYFQFPEKYLFFDLRGLRRHRSEKYFDILFLLTQAPGARTELSPGAFVLGCTPIANLFTRTSEPLRVNQRKLYYRLVADARREHTTEIHSIDNISSSMDPTDENRWYQPFYSFHHVGAGPTPKAFWYARREATGREDLPGTDLFLSFLDLDFRPTQPPNEVAFAHTLCTNRTLATQIPPGHPLQMEDVGPVTVTCLTRPTAPVYPPLGGPAVWQLISTLSLNHLSLASGEAGRDALREILRLYCFADQPSRQQQIQGIRAMSSKDVTMRVGRDAWRGFCRGTEVTLTFDEDSYTGGGAFLFAAVLRHFLALHASVNSFTQLVARRVNREEEWMRWPPLAGAQSLL
jgi:type VI secretion system protein ImpG